MAQNTQFKNLWLFDENKLLILKSLLGCDDTMCGCDITGGLKIKKSLLSYHIKKLIDADILIAKKCGRTKQYIINPSKRPFVENLLQVANFIY
jgi:ArsR family transcriptional regulator